MMMPEFTLTFLGTIPGWITAGSMITLLGIVLKAWNDGKKIWVDSEKGIRDHYAKEVASLRAQLLAVQANAVTMLASANLRYDEAIKSADARHNQCEEECERLRVRVSEMSDQLDGLQRRVSAGAKASTRLFKGKDTLPPEVKDKLEHDGD